MSKTNAWLSAKDLQMTLNVSRATAYRMIKYLPHVKVGSSIRVPRKALEDTLAANGGELPTSRRHAEDGRNGF